MIMFRGLFHYVERKSLFHRLDPRVKLLMLIPILLLAIAANNPFTLLAVFSCIILLSIFSRIPAHRYKAILSVSLISSISFLLFGAFFYFGFYHYPEAPLTIWLWIFRPEDASSLPLLGPIILALTSGKGIVLVQEGVLWGTVTTLKFLIAMFAGNWMIMTTKPKSILLALNKLGVPIKLTFVAMTSLRFIPVVMEEWYVTLNAQRTRGLKFRRMDIRGLFSALYALLSTLIANSIRRARILALAMETRAFGANVKKVSFKDLKMTRLDQILTVILLVVIVFTIILILTFAYPFSSGYTL
jgi:energy-coupling factor transport system permease protein